MQAANEAMLLVRAELCERLEFLQSRARRLSARDFTQGVDAIRTIAAAYGLIPVVRLAEALERALCEDGGRCAKSLYLGRLQDAIGCEQLDEAAGQAMLASVSVRYDS
jgi:hypothetical protein